MALTPEDLAQIKELFASQAPPAPEPQDRVSQVGAPEVPFDAGPEFYIHLANGEVVKSHDSSSTHLADAEGNSVQVIGRYQVGE